MPDFDNYIMRHGEAWVQSIVEQIERCEGIRAHIDLRLEERWECVMRAPVQDKSITV